MNPMKWSANVLTIFIPTSESSTNPKGPNKASGKMSIGEIMYKRDSTMPVSLPFWYSVEIPSLEKVQEMILGNRLNASLIDLKNYFT